MQWRRFCGQKTAVTLAVTGGIIELMNTMDDNLAIPWGLTLVILLIDRIAPNMIFAV